MMMSILDRKRKNEVISVRLNDERLQLLERYRKLLTEQFGRPISLAEAAFIILEERVERVDREASRLEMLNTPTASLWRIRKKWESQHTLSSAEWDVLAEYVQIGVDKERQEPPLLRPAVPSRQSYLAVLDAFAAVYQNRKTHASQHVWDYFGNLGGYATKVQLSDKDAGQRHEALSKQIASRRELLQPTEKWEYPGTVGTCFFDAIRDEGVEGKRLDQILAPFWSNLWGLAARGHWLQHDGQPVREPGSNDDDFRRRITLPSGLNSDELKVSFSSSGSTEFATSIDFGPSRRFGFVITRYPDLVEFRAMLEGLPPKQQPWNGRHFYVSVAKEKGATKRTLWLKQNEVNVEFSEGEWNALRDIFRQALENPGLQQWLGELQLEYGEQGQWQES